MRVLLVAVVLLLGRSVAEAQTCPSDAALSRTAAAVLSGELPANARALLQRAHDEGSTAPSLRALRVSLSDEPRRESGRATTVDRSWIDEPRRESGRATTVDRSWIDEPRRVRAFVARVAREVDGPIACGEARTEDHVFLIAAPALGRLEVDATHVRGELSASFARPALIFRFEDGEHVRVPIDRAMLARGVSLPEEAEDAPTTIQLVADGPDGPKPLAELTINGTVENADEDVRAERGARTVSASDRLKGRRAARRAPTLRDNRILEEVAAAHAEAVCRDGRVVHQLNGADPEERLRARGVRARVVGETVARGATLTRAMDALEESPAHQMTLLDRRFTDVGIGTARDRRGQRCLVILLAAWPRFLGH